MKINSIIKLINKILMHIWGKIIKSVVFISPVLYRRLYRGYLKKLGVKITGIPDFISTSANIDGFDYSLIEIGDKSIISINVLLLTHDSSSYVGFRAAGYNVGGLPKIGRIHIGNNSFIGANSILLQDTYIGNDTIVGAGSVVKGIFPDGVIIMGNPAKEVAKTIDWINKKIEISVEYRKFLRWIL